MSARFLSLGWISEGEVSSGSHQAVLAADVIQGSEEEERKVLCKGRIRKSLPTGQGWERHISNGRSLKQMRAVCQVRKEDSGVVTWRDWPERQAFWSGAQPLGKDLRTALGGAQIRECHRKVGKLAFPLPCVWEKTSYCTESRVHSCLSWEPEKNTFERQCQKTRSLDKFLVTPWKHGLETTRGSQHLF